MRAPARGALSDQERLDWLRLLRTESVGPATFWGLMDRFGAAARALEALPDLLAKRRKDVRIADAGAAARELEAHTRAGARLVACGEPAFPALLSALDMPPPLLSLRGEPDLLARPCVAIVGARNASALGRQFAEALARDLGREEITVVSGLARGIDSAAHRGSLGTGTAAVFAGGIDHVYPPENEALAQSIAETGVLIAEMPFGFKPRAEHFPRRNRLVSGLSLGVVVVEAAARSGSLITARLALEQGREVFAVPGSPLDPRAKGSNDLLRQGAVLTEGVQDVLDVIVPLAADGRLHDRAALPLFQNAPPQPMQAPTPAATQPPADPQSEEDALFALLGSTPTPADRLIQLSGLPAARTHGLLIEWELSGRIVREPCGGYCRAVPRTGS